MKVFLLLRAVSPAAKLEFAICLILNDFLTIGLISAAAFGATLIGQSISRLTIRVAAYICSIAYLFDTILLIETDSRLSRDFVRRFLPEFYLITAFLDWRAIAILIFLSLSFFVYAGSTRQTILKLLSVSLISCLLPLATVWRSNEVVRPFIFPPAILETFDFSKPKIGIDSYSPDEIAMYSRLPFYKAVKFEDSKPNVIILTLESFSYYHVKSLFGEIDYTPNFELLSKNGTLFTNFFTNGDFTEASIVATYGGYIPFRPLGASGFPFQIYAGYPSVLEELAKIGYSSYYYSAFRIAGLADQIFLSKIPFKEVLGDENSPPLVPGPLRGDWPEDQLVYARVIERVRKSLQSKELFLIGIHTSFTHTPFDSGMRTGNSELNIWKIADEQLMQFYTSLESIGFFNSGILIINGDHRVLKPITEVETRSLGAAVRNRVPFLVLGRGISKGVRDPRPLQQIDIINSLPKLGDPKAELSSAIMVSNWRWGNGIDIKPMSRVRVLDPESNFRFGYEADLLGKNIIWRNGIPPNRSSLESKIHSQHARTQRQSFSEPCSKSYQPSQGPSKKLGIRADFFKGHSLDDNLNQRSKRFVRRRTLGNLNFRHIPAGFFRKKREFAATFDTFLMPPETGMYSLRIEADDGVCVWIDGKSVIKENRAQRFTPFDKQVELTTQPHRVFISYSQLGMEAGIRLSWVPPGESTWRPISGRHFRLPLEHAARSRR